MSVLPTINPTLLDRALGWLSPSLGLQRLRARTHLAMAGQYLGGSLTRRQTAGWAPFNGSADRDALGDRRILRSRSRDLQRNAPIARGAINTVVTAAIGTGLALRVRIKADEVGLSPEAARALAAERRKGIRPLGE